jgi:hypothetical protein
MGESLEDSFSSKDFKPGEIDGLLRSWNEENNVIDLVQQVEQIYSYSPHHPLLRYCLVEYDSPDPKTRSPVGMKFSSGRFFKDYHKRLSSLTTQEQSFSCFRSLVSIAARIVPTISLRKNIRDSHAELRLLDPENEALKFVRFGENDTIIFPDVKRLKEYAEILPSDIDTSKIAQDDYFSIEAMYLEIYNCVLEKAIAQAVSTKERANVVLEMPEVSQEKPSADNVDEKK